MPKLQNAFDRFFPTLRSESPRLWLFTSASGLEHPLRRRRRTRRVRDLGHDEQLVPSSALPGGNAGGHEMLFHDLCSRPVVTSTHETPNSQARRSRIADPRSARLPYDARAYTRR